MSRRKIEVLTALAVWCEGARGTGRATGRRDEPARRSRRRADDAHFSTGRNVERSQPGLLLARLAGSDLLLFGLLAASSADLSWWFVAILFGGADLLNSTMVGWAVGALRKGAGKG